MKIKLLTPALVAILGLALAGAPVNAKKTSSSAGSTSTDATSGETNFHGTVSHVDAPAKSLTVTVTKKDDVHVELVLAVTSDTKGGDILSTLAVGDKVSGSYTTDPSGTMTATDLKKDKAKKGKGGKGAKAGAE